MKTMTEREALEAYRKMLNKVYGAAKVAGYEYDTARALELLDETAFHCGLSDWIYSEKIKIEASEDRP